MRSRRKFEKRETVLGKNVQRIAEEFVGPRAEGIEVPPLPENLGELRDLDKSVIRGLAFERIDPNGGYRICGFDYDQPPREIQFLGAFPRRDGCYQEPGRVTVEIEIYEPTASFDILLCQVAQQEGLPAAGFTEQCQMLGPAALRDRDPMGIRLTVHHPSAKIERAMVWGSSAPGGASVPQAGKSVSSNIFIC